MYEKPTLSKRERLSDVLGGIAVASGNESLPKGGCFQPSGAYAPPTLQKRDKLSEVTGAGIPPVSGAED